MAIEYHCISPQHCPNCAHVLDAHFAGDLTTERAPRSGDFSVCAYCGIALTYSNDLRLRVLKRSEIKALPLDERHDIKRAQRYARVFRALKDADA